MGFSERGRKAMPVVFFGRFDGNFGCGGSSSGRFGFGRLVGGCGEDMPSGRGAIIRGGPGGPGGGGGGFFLRPRPRACSNLQRRVQLEDHRCNRIERHT